MSLQQQLQQPYARDAWQHILHGLFPGGSLVLFSTPQPLAATQEKVQSTHQLGTITLPDGNTIALLEVETTDQVKLARNRVGLRNFVSTFIDEAGASAVLAVFHQAKSPDWRLTYAARRTILDEETFEITTVETAPKRFTFLLGGNESCRTAAGRLAGLAEKGEDLGLEDVEKSFSVETLSKEFFRKYKEHYQSFVDHLLAPANALATREILGIPQKQNDKEQDAEDKPIRDFVKTLLGRLVFLHFLQKKGWLGCKAGTKPWIGGEAEFLQSFFQLARSKSEAELFHSRYLCPLFFEALNTPDRPGDIFPLTGSRLPYLNGGLFEETSGAHRTLDFPPEYFARLLDFFGEYNFTIDENDPDDHEIGIDPEMLSHIFENLLEDNKDKGAFYTPKTIVSFKCRQSLLHYLQSHLGKNKELEILLNEKDPTKHQGKDSFVAQHREAIIKLLDEVKICDPAIGSGAFPIGLLREILWTLLTLQPDLNTPAERAKLKRRIIQNSIHGVDIDPGAIEIARLRFWLALVVDEDEPRPLPNLDYKIHRANSLIETIRGEPIRLDKSPPNSKRFDDALAHLVAAKEKIFTAQRIPEKRTAFLDLYRSLAAIGNEIFVWMKLEADFTNPERMAYLDRTARQFSAWINQIDGIRKEKVHMQETLLGKLREWFDDPHAPTFLWKLHFGEIMARGRFDIVIANPPYVRHETISAYAPLLKDRYSVAASRADLFIFFYEQSYNILKDGGVLTYITSNKYFRAAYGKKLRPFLSENLTIETLIDFGDAPVFDAIAYASIIIGCKKPPEKSHKLRAYVWRLEDFLNRINQVLDAGSFEIQQSKLSADGWQLEAPASFSLLEKIRSKGVPLAKHVGGQFFYGIKTGLNEAFVIDSKRRDELIAEDPKSAELIKPFLGGKDVKRWKVTHKDKYLIVFPEGFNKKLEGYPAILTHLSAFEEKLKKRGQCTTSRGGKNEGQHHWLELDNNPKPDYLKLFELPKIIYPDIYLHQSFCYEDKGYYSTNTTYFIAKDDPALCAILNSNVVEWFYANTSNRIRGGYLRSFSNYIKQIPIPVPSEEDKERLAELAKACSVAAAKSDTASLNTLESEINRIVYRLFDLKASEIAQIEEAVGAPVLTGTHGHTKEKDALFRRLRSYGLESPYFSLAKVTDDPELSELTAKKDLLREYLSEAMEKRVIHDSGRGWYSSLETPAVLDPEATAPLRDSLTKRFPFLPHYVWSTRQVNPWMQHQLGKSVQFVQVESDGEDDVAAFLRNEGWSVIVNPTAKTAKNFAPGERSVVIRGIRRPFDPTTEPRVENVLVDLMLENSRLHLMDEGERQDMSRKLLTTNRLEIATLFARLRDHKRNLADLVGSAEQPIIAEK
jgi:hypothetical protein